jgi:hypothetical protein
MPASFVRNAFVQWIDYRLPVFTFIDRELIDYPTPQNLSYWWNFGSLAGITLVIMIISGVFLAMACRRYRERAPRALRPRARPARCRGARAAERTGSVFGCSGRLCQGDEGCCGTCVGGRSCLLARRRPIDHSTARMRPWPRRAWWNSSLGRSSIFAKGLSARCLPPM